MSIASKRTPFKLRTPAECRIQNRANSHRWARHGDGFTAFCEALDACTRDDPCDRCYCAFDTGALRHGIVQQSARIFDTCVGGESSFLTVYLCSVRVDELQDVQIDRIKHDLRMLLRRSGFDGFSVGGIEAGFRPKDDCFLIHAHLIARGISPSVKHALRKKLRKRFGDRSLFEQPVRDLHSQLSYCIKFPLWHHPGQPGASRPRAKPLPKGPLLALLRWYERAPREMLFLTGLRWSAGKLKLVSLNADKPPAIRHRENPKTGNRNA